jgi:subtilase family serine protease
MQHTFRRWLVALALVLPTLAILGGFPAHAASFRLPTDVRNPCAAATRGHATCGALAVEGRTDARPATAAAPAGFAPADLRGAYGLPDSTSLGDGETVAVVTAYDDPDAASDLATYRSQYSLPACGSGCFSKVNQTGGTTYPGTSAGWSAAVAQSLDMISAICPQCHLLLVEATSTAITDLGTAEDQAVTLGASFVDNDWFTPESTLGASEPSYDTAYFDHPGVAITAPAGNSGYGVSYPAASPDVTAVGGTTLTSDSGVTRGWTETAWDGSGSGCSEYEAKPAWQTDTGCSNRTLNDTAAVADPNTPIAYYDTPTAGGWGQGGGTDVSAAIVAAAYALAGTPAPGSNPASYLYDHPGSNMFDVTSGSNGTCSPSTTWKQTVPSRPDAHDGRRHVSLAWVVRKS